MSMSPLGYHPILIHSAQNIRKTSVPNIKHQGKWTSSNNKWGKFWIRSHILRQGKHKNHRR